MALADRMIRQVHPLGVRRHPHSSRTPESRYSAVHSRRWGPSLSLLRPPETGLELFLQIGVFRKLQAKVCLRLLPACQVQPPPWRRGAPPPCPAPPGADPPAPGSLSLPREYSRLVRLPNASPSSESSAGSSRSSKFQGLEPSDLVGRPPAHPGRARTRAGPHPIMRSSVHNIQLSADGEASRLLPAGPAPPASGHVQASCCLSSSRGIS